MPYGGIDGDVPVPADYDGDRKTDIGTFRPSSSLWFLRPSGGGPDILVTFGIHTDTTLALPYSVRRTLTP